MFPQYCPNFVKILSKYYPDIIKYLQNTQILPKYYPKYCLYIVQIFYKYFPNIVQILSNYYLIIVQIFLECLIIHILSRCNQQIDPNIFYTLPKYCIENAQLFPKYCPNITKCYPYIVQIFPKYCPNSI